MSPLTTTLLALTVMAAVLIALAVWIRRSALKPVPAGRAAMPLRSLGEACPALLMAAEAPPAQRSGGSGSPAGGGGGAGASPPAPRRKQKTGPDRRTFLRGAMALTGLGTLGSFGVASIAFLWPNLRGGFGAVIEVGDQEDILAEINGDGQGRFEFPQGRALIVAYDESLDPDGQYADVTNGAAVMALYQKCVHLGCKVPWCVTSQWWECPCHGSRYNRWGEYQAGPAPRGLDRFSVSVEDGVVMLDTSNIITGPARQADALDQPAEGPSCV